MVDESQKSTAEEYDPDAPPESPEYNYNHIGRLTDTIKLEGHDDAEAAGIGDRYDGFNKEFVKANGFEPACWLIKSEALNVVVKELDGTIRPAEMSQLVRLQGKKRGWLGTGQAPDLLAAEFRNHGVSASYLAKEREDTAVGHIFYFVEHEVELGGRRRKFKKGFSMWPQHHFGTECPIPEGLSDGDEFTVDGVTVEFRVIEVQDEEAAVAESQAGPTVSEEEATAILVEELTGKTPADMSDVLVNSERLKNVDTLFGVTLLSAAVDETLATVLQEKGHMALVDGTLQPVAVPSGATAEAPTA